MARPWLRLLAGFATAVAALANEADPAGAIPAFARKYGVSCTLCHAPPPRLTAFGEQFAANGFAMTAGEEPRDTMQSGDALLRLLRRIEVAFRLDMFATASTPVHADRPSVDLQTPWNIKVLSGGEIASGISYYMYFFLGERGEVAGLEDAYIQFTDIASSGISVIAGQFQVSDPLFKRELRLPYDDYQAYRLRAGEVRADLTYDRGLFATASPWEGADLALMLVNGQGIGAAGETRTYDTDNLKNVAVRFSQQFGPVRAGGFGYFGRAKAAAASDRITVWGPDATLAFGDQVELNLQYLRREDSNPVLDVGGESSTIDSGFAELLWSPHGPQGRWHMTALYNRIRADRPIVSLRMGDEGLVRDHHAASAGVHYLLHRNVRILVDLGYDLERERTRFTAGTFLAW